MTMLSKIATRVFPNVVAPPPLKGLAPSWSGIFKRIVCPTKEVHHPEFGKYFIVHLSRDEEKRLAIHNYDLLRQKFPNWIDVDLEKYFK